MRKIKFSTRYKSKKEEYRFTHNNDLFLEPLPPLESLYHVEANFINTKDILGPNKNRVKSYDIIR